MTSSPRTTEISLSCNVTDIEQSRLASMTPHVLRLRAVRTDRGPMPVYLEHLHDDVLVGTTLHTMLYDLARIVARQLGQSSALMRSRPLPLQLHTFDEPMAPGPAVEVVVCLHEREGVLMEICLDGLENIDFSGGWIVDALVSTSWKLLDDQH